MRHHRPRTLVLLIALTLALASCGAASTKTLLVTGESIDATGKQFVKVGAAFNELLDAKVITADQYKPWATFAAHFKYAYPKAVALWRDARTAQDTAAEEQAAAVIRALGADLVTFAAQTYEYLKRPAGTAAVKGGK